MRMELSHVALGELVQGLTHSDSWLHMAIYVVEDDAPGR
jgi:hypothetical protein